MSNSFQNRNRIRVGIVGVGNCASSLVQGVSYYRDSGSEDGLIFPKIQNLKVGDIEFVCAFDVDRRKVGKPLAEAVFSKPNNSKIFYPNCLSAGNPYVMMGKVLDSVSADMCSEEGVYVSDESCSDMVSILRSNSTEILVSYLPVGSTQATEAYARVALEAGCSFINCIPVPLADSDHISSAFREKGIHLLGDDIKSQVGATIVHQRLIELLGERGVIIENSYQLNIGGNSDFRNMLNHQRLCDKRRSKTGAITRRSATALTYESIRVGPSDYVPFLKDEKRAFIHISGLGFAGASINIEHQLIVQDSPNSAGSVVDLIRFSRVIDCNDIDRVTALETYYMKSPRNDIGDAVAYDYISRCATG